jgi:tetratricopeptide (TPR) repeat protein
MPFIHRNWCSPSGAGVWLLLSLALGAPALAHDASDAPPPVRERQSLDSRIAHWIKELGAEQYARREKAQTELQRLGLAAFEALHEAQDHEDVEIALRARYLVRSMTIQLVRPDDPAEVREVLKDYADKSNDERRSTLEDLSKLEDGQGLPVLCRLARFENSHLLSKQAALLVMQRAIGAEPPRAATLSDALTRELGPSRRAAVHWLELFAKTLTAPEPTVAEWDRLVRDEERLLRDTPEKSSPQIVRDLLRWQADLFERLHRPQDAVAAVTRSLTHLDGTVEQLLETADWLIQRKAWTMVERLAQQFPARFADQATLCYRLAEAQLRQGQREPAEQTAQRALQIRIESPAEHVPMAYALQERGLFDWAEREYRRVIQAGPAGALHDLRARSALSEMLHDQGRELPAAEVLQGTVDVLDKNANAAQKVMQIGRDPGSFRSRMHYFYAEHFRAAGDRQKQLHHLQQGAKHDPNDVDVLIAMYRTQPENKEWHKAALDHIQQATKYFREQLEELVQQRARQPDNEDFRAVLDQRQALLCNQLAWLVGNTVGDYDEAVRLSRKSLELVPNTASYLDTLGRCYYAKGDYENAVKHQSRALELDPHSGLMRRQLELFQRALQQKQGQPPAAKTPGAHEPR